jgi:putative glutamine amidotransferase
MLISERRQKFDIAFARSALENELPVFGICGGHQLINIVSGGTLYTSLADQVDGVLTHWPENLSGPVYRPITVDRTGGLFVDFETNTLREIPFTTRA